MDVNFVFYYLFVSYAHYIGGNHAAELLGCYGDSENRALPHLDFELPDTTPSKCINACMKKGYQFAGIQVGVQCFCGNTLPSTKITEALCNVPCGGDRSVMCGGPWTNNVYSTGVTTTTVSTTTLSPQESVCRKIMDGDYLNVFLIGGNTCQYRCINNSSKKGVYVFKTDGDRCNNGQGICLKGVCEETVQNSGCPSDFYGVRNICKMICYSVQNYPGMSVVMNVPEGEICINKREDHGICTNGKCVISQAARK